MSGSAQPVDIRIGAISRRFSTEGIALLAVITTGADAGEPAAVDPSVFSPDAASVTEAELAEAIATRQDATAKGLANGYAPLDGAGKVPVIHLPATSGPTLADEAPRALAGTAAPGNAITVSRSDHQHPLPSLEDLGAAPVVHTHALSGVTGLTGALNARELAANKGQPGGYAPIGTDGKIPGGYLPAGLTQSSLDAKADVTAVNSGFATLTTAVNLKANTTDVNTALGTKAAANDARIVNAIQPDHLSPVEDITANYTVLQTDANKIKRYKGSGNIVITLPSRSVGTVVRFRAAAGAGKMSFTAGNNQTVENFNSLFQSAGGKANVIATVVDLNIWDITGDLA